MLTKVHHEGPRVETGPLQFGDDWPGIFIRGDNALADAAMLEIALKQLPEPEKDDLRFRIARNKLEGYIELLRSCHAENFREQT